ncbi:hypothetical protein D3C85_1221030 [compost metagenome]
MVGQVPAECLFFSPSGSVMMALRTDEYLSFSWRICCCCSSLRLENSRVIRVSLCLSLKLKETKAWMKRNRRFSGLRAPFIRRVVSSNKSDKADSISSNNKACLFSM